MDIIIHFFRDTLSGPTYIVVAVMSGILICSCIGYLAERSINKKKQKNKYAQIENPISTPNQYQQTPVANTTQVTSATVPVQNVLTEQPNNQAQHINKDHQ